MIQAVYGGNLQREMARCTCDDCGHFLDVPAAHGHNAKQMKGGRVRSTIASEGQVIIKMQALGWSLVKNKLLCPDCANDRRARHVRLVEPNPIPTPQTPKEPAMPTVTSPSTVTEIRQPTREQRRLIMEMLQATYDVKALRYTGKDTDKTVADAIGGGVMPGWVAEVREEFFGPAGGNEEIEAVIADIEALRKTTDDLIRQITGLGGQMDAAMSAVTEVKARITEQTKRIEAVKAAVGPKAARA